MAHPRNPAYSATEGDIIINSLIQRYQLLFSRTSHDQHVHTAMWNDVVHRVKDVGMFRIRAYRYVQVIIFAIKEINSKKLLSNITLGFSLYDGCFSETRALDNTLRLLSGCQQSVPNYSCQSGSLISGFVGDEPGQSALPMAKLLGIYRYPQISFGSALAMFSDKIQFPSFFRTVAPDINLARGMAKMMLHFGWNWVGVIGAEYDHNQEFVMGLKNEILKTGACIEFLEILPIENVHIKVLQIIDKIQKSTTKIIMNYAAVQYAIPVIEEAANQNVTGKIWIAPTYWSISPDLSKKIKDALNGSVGFAIHKGLIPGFKEFLYNIHPSRFPDDPFVKIFWEEAFFCKWQDNENLQSSSAKARSDVSPCTGEEKLETLDTTVFDVNNFRFTYGVYNAVYSLAHALYNLQKCTQSEGPFNNGSCASLRNFQPWQVLHYMKTTRFVNTAGEEIFYDKYGDSPALYDIQNWQVLPDGSGRYVKVGAYNSTAAPGEELIINSNNICWSKDFAAAPRSVCSESCPPGFRVVVQEGRPLCCFVCIPCPVGEISNQSDAIECLRCPEDQWHDLQHTQCSPKVVEFLSYEEPLGVSLAFFAVCLSVVSASILGLFVRNRETPIVKANNREVSYLLLLSLCLCFLSSLMFIGEPKKMSCLLRQTGFGIIFSICVSSILAKTIIVVIAFKATVPKSKLRKWVGLKTPLMVILFCFLIQVIICCVWIANTPSFPERNMNSQDGKIILQCNEGSISIFYCMLGYLFFLASVSFIVAFLVRSLPDSFNEAKFITFSMLVFTSVWISFIPAYLSTTGKYMVAVEVFAILASSAGLLVCIFFPKCYIILIRSDLNTKGNLIGKGNVGSKVTDYPDVNFKITPPAAQCKTLYSMSKTSFLKDNISKVSYGLEEKTSFPSKHMMSWYITTSSTSRFRIRAYRYVQVVVYAINEINNSKKFLPNMTLGFSLYDGCFSEIRALENTLRLLSGRQQAVPNYSCQLDSLIPGFVGDEPGQSALPMAKLLGIYRYPQISFGSAVAIFSDKFLFPSFFRTVAPDINLARGMAKMMLHFGWNWVGVIGADYDNNQEFVMGLKSEILKTGACIEFLEVLPIENVHIKVLQIIETIRKSTTQVIINYASVQYAIPVIEEAANQNITGKAWIAPTYWSISPDLSRKVKYALNGSVGFAIHKGLIPGFEEFLYNIHPTRVPDDPFVKRFWEQAFFCKWQDNENLQSSSAKARSDASPCTGEEKLETLDTTVFDVNNFRFTYGVYNAVYSLAHALYNLQKCKQSEGPFNNGSCASLRNFQPWQSISLRTMM
ncbi:vomeronasal type-2 receptor 1-like [Protopterus annectens]|uniref:vomeronasal type-2 receptor 1-like n=1 Tax=Protopterus annectens TaxID=7888 RepID=UPI001CFBF810|nr:vomeronasal type-2 receptor 1-like [Protopterus annectens]